MPRWLSALLDSNEKELKRIQLVVKRINELEPEYERLSNDELRSKTRDFKGHFQAGSTFDDFLPEAFALVREAAKRTLGQRHFDVQLTGGIVLHQGKIAEMRTGEGKTLVATLPLYLNSLAGKGCHLVTVNDYLSKRDAHWMGPVFHALGVTVGSIQHDSSFVYDPEYEAEDKTWDHMRPVSRQEAYTADITYGTNNEFGFDYLRDNMVVDLARRVQRPLYYAIVDEVDNILIDEARTPLIISGPAAEAEQKYQSVDSVVRNMRVNVLPHEPVTREEKESLELEEQQYDYIAYEKGHIVKETARGQEKLARALGMTVEDLFGSDREEEGALTGEAQSERSEKLGIFRQSMIAHALYKKERDYVVRNNDEGRPEVVIVDEFTGRLMHGRRYSRGLHQAIEAKERVQVRRESMTYATITFQNYFRMYEKLAGMTGTAVTEAEEFHKIYKLDVVVLPTNVEYRASQGDLNTTVQRENGVDVINYENPDTGEHFQKRIDFTDQIYKDEDAKFRAVVREVEQLHKENRPVLIGTVSIEKSEDLSGRLQRKGVKHQVLNAKLHEKEAGIIAQAGRLGSVTVATNMAGRGVDIVLGGRPEGRSQEDWRKEHDEVISLGGLHIVGTERHEARRIDNQLRGRAGRQGDPGSSRFYVSLEDDIMRRFGGDRVKTVMEWAGFDEDTPIENKMINRSIEGAQVKVEGHNFDIRKHLVEYDDVINKQRELIYAERNKILGGADLKANILSMVAEEIRDAVATHFGNGQEEGDINNLLNEVSSIFPLPPEVNASAVIQMKPEQIEERLVEQAEAVYEQREKDLGVDNMRMMERLLMLRVIDNLWVEHLTEMDHMRQGIGLQAAAQRDPLVAYKREGAIQFDALMETIRHDVVHYIYHAGLTKQTMPKKVSANMAKIVASRGDNGQKQPQKVKVAGKKVGRNDPCPCGSGKKYKHCCGR